jgi:hypothetical protein
MAIEVWTHLSVSPDNAVKQVLMSMDPDDARALSEILLSVDLHLFNQQWAEAIDKIAAALRDKAGNIK